MFDLVFLLSISAAGMDKKSFFLIIKKKWKIKIVTRPVLLIY